MARFCRTCGTQLADETARVCAKCGTAVAGSVNGIAEALLRRYRDAYNIANGTVQVGGMLKKAAIWVAGFFGVIGLLACLYSLFFGIPLVLVGLLFGFLLFVSGIITAAQGQIMLAVLDTAVNTSPNTDGTEKATIMGLGFAPRPQRASAIASPLPVTVAPAP